jgi:hypothetical protein
MKTPYEEQNIEAANMIAADVQRYGGEQAALVVWARRVIESSEAPPAGAACGPLFQQRAA